MDRREFLKALGVLLAAASVPVMADRTLVMDLASEPDWTAWNFLEFQVDTPIKMIVNGVQNNNPRVAARAVAAFEEYRKVVKFPMSDVLPVGTRVGFAYKQQDPSRWPGDPVPYVYYDDIYAGDKHRMRSVKS